MIARADEVVRKRKGNAMPAAVETFKDGSAAFFSNREVPWHALGTITDGAQTAEDALRLAQLDWDVVKSEEPVQVPVLTPNGVEMVSVPDKFMTYRNHPKLGLQGLGVVGSQYTVIQNKDAFDFLNALVDEGGAVFETAGSLFDGRQVFMSMKLPNSIELAGGQDTLDLYLIATTSHDGTKAFTVYLSYVRPVCANTVQWGLSSAVDRWYLKHTTGVSSKVQAARETLGLVFKHQADFEAEVQRMVSTPMSTREFTAFTHLLVPMPKTPTLRQATRIETVHEQLAGLWVAPTQEPVKNTRYAAFNAVTEWVDWVKPIRAKKRDEDVVRAQRVFVPKSDALKKRALVMLAK